MFGSTQDVSLVVYGLALFYASTVCQIENVSDLGIEGAHTVLTLPPSKQAGFRHHSSSDCVLIAEVSEPSMNSHSVVSS